MKVITKTGEHVRGFKNVTNLIQTIDEFCYLDGTICRIEFTTDEFKRLMREDERLDLIGIPSNFPEDYSGCYVLLQGICLQTHSSYYE